MNCISIYFFCLAIFILNIVFVQFYFFVLVFFF